MRKPANDNLGTETLERIRARWGDRIQQVVTDRGQVTLVVSAQDAYDVVATLRNEFAFDFPCDITAIDYSEWPEEGEYTERFAIVYSLLSLERNERVRIKALVSELEPEIKSTHDLFGCADWCEREIYDMFGIRFTGHPNLIRLLCPEDLKGHALRKDYPLTGRGERDDFPVYQHDQA